MPCDHDATDLEVAILADGMCPLCLNTEIDLLKMDAEEGNEITNNLRSELEKAKAEIAALIDAIGRSSVTEERHRAERAENALAAVIIEGDCLAEVALSGPDTEIDKYVALWCKATHDYRALRNTSEGEG